MLRASFLAVLAGLLPLFAFWICLTSGNVVDLDLWHQMAFAREALRSGSIPQQDVFAYTPVLPASVNHEWAAGFIALWVIAASGSAGLVVLNLLLGAAALAIGAVCAYRGGADPRFLAVAGCICVPLLAITFPPLRAQAYSFVFFAALLFAIDRDRAGNRWALFAWLPAFLLWTNLHGSIIMAFLALGLYILDCAWNRRPLVRPMLAAAVAAALTFANPFGPELHMHLWQTMRMQRPLITEWAPLWSGPNAGALRPLSVLMSVLVYALWKRKAHLHGAILVILSAAGALLHLKLLPYFVLAWLCYVPAWLSGTPVSFFVSGILRENRRAASATWAVLTVSALVGLGVARFWEARVPDSGQQYGYPVGAVDYLREQGFRGNVMTHFNYGAYVSWRLFPSVRVSMDSRYDVAYPESIVYEVEHVYRSGEWSGFFSRHHTDAVIIPSGALSETSLASMWHRVYRDRAFCVYAPPEATLRTVDLSERGFEGSLP